MLAFLANILQAIVLCSIDMERVDCKQSIAFAASLFRRFIFGDFGADYVGHSLLRVVPISPVQSLGELARYRLAVWQDKQLAIAYRLLLGRNFLRCW